MQTETLRTAGQRRVEHQVSFRLRSQGRGKRSVERDLKERWCMQNGSKNSFLYFPFLPLL